MILLVPVSPEVPRVYSRKIWPGLVLVIFLCLGFLEANEHLNADSKFIESLYTVSARGQNDSGGLRPEAYPYLRMRPLLRIAPAPADFDLKRVLYSNFIHGSIPHLSLNLIGAFVGARICSVFVPFLCTLSIFVLGGSIGIWVSLLLSPQSGEFIPHVGASGGIFALMGAYYVYNFKFRTKYFFWFPSKQGTIALKTSWFFFVDVILLEVVLSAAQLLPQRADSVDHLAHVFGFGAGLCIALFLRGVQRWPAFLQTRGEFLYWKRLGKPEHFDPITSPLEKWLELLEINPQNDLIKLKLFRHLYNNCHRLSDKHVEHIFKFVSPTFVRLHSDEVSSFVREILSKSRKIPSSWYKRMSYDSIIRLAKFMTSPPEEQHLLMRLVVDYRQEHKQSIDIDRKLELLLRKLNQLMPESKRLDPAVVDGKRGNEAEGNLRPLEERDSTPETAKKASGSST